MKEYFVEIVVSLDNLVDEAFKEVVLEIKRLEKNVGFTGYYIDDHGEKKWLNIFEFDLDHKIIHQLYEKTQRGEICHTDWNRAVFTLLPNNKFEMEYKWDQDLQDQVNGYNKGTKPIA